MQTPCGVTSSNDELGTDIFSLTRTTVAGVRWNGGIRADCTINYALLIVGKQTVARFWVGCRVLPSAQFGVDFYQAGGEFVGAVAPRLRLVHHIAGKEAVWNLLIGWR